MFQFDNIFKLFTEQRYSISVFKNNKIITIQDKRNAVATNGHDRIRSQ